MTKITRSQVMQLLVDCDIQPRSPDLIGNWKKFAQAVLARFGEPEWQPIETAPSDGRFFVAVDAKNSWLMAIGNHPVGCNFGYWIYDKQRKEWMGSSAQFSGQSFTHWKELPARPPIED